MSPIRIRFDHETAYTRDECLRPSKLKMSHRDVSAMTNYHRCILLIERGITLLAIPVLALYIPLNALLLKWKRKTAAGSLTKVMLLSQKMMAHCH